jgi:hypothetical protein
LYSGTKAVSYFPNGYGKSKWSWKKSRPCLVTVKTSSASKCFASPLRHSAPSGISSSVPSSKVRRSVPAVLGPALLRAVADHQPALGRGHLEGERGLQIGLFEVGEDPAGVGRFVLRVEVDLAVLGVHEAVQALTGPAVGALGVDDEGVLGGQPVQRDPGAVEHRRRVQLPAVEGDRGDRGSQQVREGRGAGLGAAEAERRAGAEGLGRRVTGDR